MKIKHIKNATRIIKYANNRFLSNPMLGENGSNKSLEFKT